MQAVRLAIVIPCYNEADTLQVTRQCITAVMQEMEQQQLITSNSYALLVDDGSKDNTWLEIATYCATSPVFKGLKLSRNFGHQNAVMAGIQHATDVDAVVCIDADMQDDPKATIDMVRKYREGYEVVYGVRNNRKTDSFLKRSTAQLFYKLLAVMGIEVVYNHADYRLMGRRAVTALDEFTEVNLYLRGMVPLVGFKATSVYYARSERKHGTSKYGFWKMMSFAWSGISSFSIKPLHFVTFCGFAFFFLSIALTIYAKTGYLMHKTTPGWASTVIPIYFLGGIQLLCIGLIGEYVAKIYSEVKRRPRYIVEDFVD